MWNVRATLILFCLLIWAVCAHAQSLEGFFPAGVPGYGTEPGVTVRSRARPAFDPFGMRFDTVMLHPRLDQTIGFDDNIFGGSSRRGAWEIRTQPSLLAVIDQSDFTLGGFISADRTNYLGVPSQNRTDFNMFLGGTEHAGSDKITVAIGYLSGHEDRTALDALPSDRPVGFEVFNARGSYETKFSRVTLTPSIEMNDWHFENTTVLGVPVNQAARDRVTLQGTVDVRYDWMTGRDVRVISRMLDTEYTHAAVGVPSNNSRTWRTLAGVDYDGDTVWRYRLMVGFEVREASSAAVAAQVTGAGEAEVIWQPSGLTTVTLRAVRGIADAAQAGLSNYTYNGGELTLDHELYRNVLISGSVTVRQAHFNQTGGDQAGAGLGLGVTWLINRDLRLITTYNFDDVRNSHLPSGTVAGNYDRDLLLLTLRVGL